MSNLIDQIKIFHALNLQPICEHKRKIWELEIDKYLININKIKESFVKVENIKHIKKRTSRLKRKKRCCILCQ